jgi:hypothetical protein
MDLAAGGEIEPSPSPILTPHAGLLHRVRRIQTGPVDR